MAVRVLVTEQFKLQGGRREQFCRLAYLFACHAFVRAALVGDFVHFDVAVGPRIQGQSPVRSRGRGAVHGLDAEKSECEESDDGLDRCHGVVVFSLWRYVGV